MTSSLQSSGSFLDLRSNLLCEQKKRRMVRSGTGHRETRPDVCCKEQKGGGERRLQTASLCGVRGEDEVKSAFGAEMSGQGPQLPRGKRAPLSLPTSDPQ